MRKRFFSIIVCVVMLFTMNVTAFAAETQENYSETEKTMTFEITPTALTSGSSRHSVGMLNSFFGTNDTVATSALGHGKKLYVQVSYLLASEETIQREFGAFAGVRDNFPKYVVTMDELDMSRDGIKHRNIRDFLLAEEWN